MTTVLAPAPQTISSRRLNARIVFSLRSAASSESNIIVMAPAAGRSRAAALARSTRLRPGTMDLSMCSADSAPRKSSHLTSSAAPDGASLSYKRHDKTLFPEPLSPTMATRPLLSRRLSTASTCPPLLMVSPPIFCGMLAAAPSLALAIRSASVAPPPGWAAGLSAFVALLAARAILSMRSSAPSALSSSQVPASLSASMGRLLAT